MTRSRQLTQNRQRQILGLVLIAGIVRGLASLEASPMMKLLYKPWGMLAGVIGGALAGGAVQAGLEGAERRGRGPNGY